MIAATCPCGATPATAPNPDCERCRLVYTLRTAERMRSAQRDYHTGRTGEQLREAKALERRLDRLLERLNEIQPSLFNGDDDDDPFRTTNQPTDRQP